MSDIRVYEPACSTCRNLFNLLQEMGVDFDKVDYTCSGTRRTAPSLRARRAG